MIKREALSCPAALALRLWRELSQDAPGTLLREHRLDPVRD